VTKTARKRAFSEFVKELTGEEEYVAKYPAPALLLEPFGEGSAETVDTPAPGDSSDDGTIARMMTAGSAFVQPSTSMVHPEARVVWLVKSDRNPFEGMITVGRARNNDLILAHPEISKVHAIFQEDGDWWLIEDRSSNGTFLDGTRLPARELRQVNDGSRVRFGDVASVRFFEPESFYQFCSLVRGSP
jgi:hypothetical protein